MKLRRLLLTAGLVLAALGTFASARTLPVVADASENTSTKTISKISARATNLTVAPKSAALLFFNITSSGIPVSAVTAARLILYFPKVTTAGNLKLTRNDAGFTENFTAATVAGPGEGPALMPFSVAATQAKNFVILDVTTIVQNILAGTESDFGFRITSDGTANVLIGAKEGTGTGYPAMLEIDVTSSGGAISGTTATFAGPVGIGGAPGGSQLSVFGAGGTSVDVESGGNGTAGYIQTNSNRNYFTGILGGTDRWSLFDSTAALERLSVLSNGNVGLGTTTPGFALEIAGSADTQMALRSTSTNGRVYSFQSSNGGAALGDGSFQIIDRTAGAARVLISKAGDLGIGASTGSPPAAKLDVRGDIKLGTFGQFFAVGATENLNTVRGHVQGAGIVGILEGSGYSVARLSGQATGAYRITFTPAFSNSCTATASAVNFPPGTTPQIATITGYGPSFVDVRIWTLAGALVDSEFMFIATGPR